MTTLQIVARDRIKKRVLLCGLGASGLGEMWFPDQDKYKDLPGYCDAPEQQYSNSLPDDIVRLLDEFVLARGKKRSLVRKIY